MKMVCSMIDVPQDILLELEIAFEPSPQGLKSHISFGLLLKLKPHSPRPTRNGVRSRDNLYWLCFAHGLWVCLETFSHRIKSSNQP